MTLTIFASGSTGNCALVSHGSTHILVDAGISARRIRERLKGRGLALSQLTALLVTHPHADHISGMETLCKGGLFPIYATPPVARQLCCRLPVEGRVHPFDRGEDFTLGEIVVRPIPTSHDTPGSTGFRLTSPDGRSACIVTDLGVVTDEVRQGVAGVDLAVIELNHDPRMLREGPYPYPLRQRIAGPRGHLSNAEGASLCAIAAGTAHTIVLAHLSRQNNTPALAMAAASAALPGYAGGLYPAPVLSDGMTWEV